MLCILSDTTQFYRISVINSLTSNFFSRDQRCHSATATPPPCKELQSVFESMLSSLCTARRVVQSRQLLLSPRISSSATASPPAVCCRRFATKPQSDETPTSALRLSGTPFCRIKVGFLTLLYAYSSTFGTPRKFNWRATTPPPCPQPALYLRPP
jgi:hypothetical protein